MKAEIKAYLEQAQALHQEALHALRQIILANLPEGFEETMQYKISPLRKYFMENSFCKSEI